jgi:hypothetical protein
MRRRKHGSRTPEDFYFTSAGLSWQAGVALAIVIIVALHALAAREPTTATAVQDIGTVAAQGIFRTLAAIGHYVIPLVLLGGAAASLFDRRRRRETQASKPVAPEPATSLASETDHTAASICPACGCAMVRRRVRRGTHAEQEFYGCSRYPVCQETRPV